MIYLPILPVHIEKMSIPQRHAVIYHLKRYLSKRPFSKLLWVKHEVSTEDYYRKLKENIKRHEKSNCRNPQQDKPRHKW